jgi:hypothetical protein
VRGIAGACSAASWIALLGGCTEASPGSTGIRAGDAARARGVDAYDVLEATAHDIDARLLGKVPLHLHVHSADGETVQQLDGPAPFVLSTSRERVEVETSGHPRIVAEKVGDVWRAPEGVDAATQRAIGLVLSVDVDLAVQGSSLVFGGSTFARCTETCDRASRCAEHFDAARCAQDTTLCGACLEQEP